MIIKFSLTAKQFAGLTKFIASEENENDVLKALHPGHDPSFVGTDNYKRFAVILKSTVKRQNFDEEKNDVAVLVAEKYHIYSGAREKDVPHQYLTRLYHSVDLFPFSRTFTIVSEFDSDPEPKTFEGMDNFKVCRHRGYGPVVLQKKVDGKLYVNDVEVIRRKVPKELGEGGKDCHPYLPGEDKMLLLNACFFAALWNRPHLIPEDWDQATFFRGTIFESTYDKSKWVRGISKDQKIHWHSAQIGHYNLTRDYCWEALLATAL